MSEVMVGLAEPEKKGRPRHIRGLLIEDDPAYARLVREWLNSTSEGAVHLEHSDNLSSGLDRLSREKFDLLLLDLVLPDSHGYESFAAVSKKFPKLPVVVITGMTDEGQALRALRHGAQDYLVKGRVDGAQLLRAVRFAVERKKIVQREEDFFQNVNHELRNPLTSLYTALVALESESYGSINGRQHELLDIAMRNAKHLWSMVNDLLDIARADMGKITFLPRGISLADEILEMAVASAGAAAEKKIAVKTDIADQLPPVFADPVRLRQILLNLVGNALKFTPEGGEVTLSARVWEKNASFLLIGVADTGPGIAAPERGKIFARRYQSGGPETSSHPGLGIGLYICHQLTARHGGKIWVEGTVGDANRINFTLPVFSLAKSLSAHRARGARRPDVSLVSIDPPENAGDSAASRLQAVRRTLSSDPEFAECLLPRFARQNPVSPLFLLLPAGREDAKEVSARLGARFDLPTRLLPLSRRAAGGGAAPLAGLIDKRMRAHEYSLQRPVRR